MPLLGHREIPSSDHIVLAPMNYSHPPTQEKSSGSTSPLTECHILDLRFHFHGDLDDQIFQKTADELHTLIKERRIDAKRITFVDKRSLNRESLVIERWRLLIAERHQQLSRKYFQKWWAIHNEKKMSKLSTHNIAQGMMTPVSDSRSMQNSNEGMKDRFDCRPTSKGSRKSNRATTGSNIDHVSQLDRLVPGRSPRGHKRFTREHEDHEGEGVQRKRGRRIAGSKQS
jgi:hypothetical protein